MSKWGSVDFRELKKLQKQLERMERMELQKFFRDCAKELAARLLAKVIKRTPVGQYNKSTGVMGGTLRRGWTAKTEQEARVSGNPNAMAYAQSLTVTRLDDVYQIEIINPVHYASYVEYGHRTRNHRGWVEGRFMLTISEEELDKQAPTILEGKIRKYLEECFGD